MSEEVGAPIARMMMSVAGQALVAYVQLRAIAEVLIEKGVFTREELEDRFREMRVQELSRTIDEWFPPDVAHHVKLAFETERAVAESAEGVAPPDPDDVARARAMQAD